MRGKSQRVARPAQTRLQNSGVTGPNFAKFLTDLKESSAVLTRASLLRSSHPVWNASAQNEGWDMPILADSHQQSVTIATSLERSQKRLD